MAWSDGVKASFRSHTRGGCGLSHHQGFTRRFGCQNIGGVWSSLSSVSLSIDVSFAIEDASTDFDRSSYDAPSPITESYVILFRSGLVWCHMDNKSGEKWNSSFRLNLSFAQMVPQLVLVVETEVAERPDPEELACGDAAASGRTSSVGVRYWISSTFNKGISSDISE